MNTNNSCPEESGIKFDGKSITSHFKDFKFEPNKLYSSSYKSFHMGIFPRFVFIMQGEVEKNAINYNFTDINGDELIFPESTNFDGSLTWNVIEKSTNKRGFLVQMIRESTAGDYAHIATNIAIDTFKELDFTICDENEEILAYLIEFIANKLYENTNH